MRNIILFVLFAFIFVSCKSELSKEKLFEEKIKKELQDEAFKLNCSLEIIELTVNKIHKTTLDSVYRECYYGRALKLMDYAEKQDKDYGRLTDTDEKLKKFLQQKREADPTKIGYYIWYYIKGTFTNRENDKTNILYKSIIAYFDNRFCPTYCKRPIFP